MDDKVSRLKSLADLRDSGILSEAEFEAEKSKIMNEPSMSSPPYGAPPPMGGMPMPPQMMSGGKGNGPIPFKRRNGWLWWIAYLVIAFGGSILGMMMYSDAMYGGECYTESTYYGSYEYCDPDYELIFIADMVSIASSILTLIIWIYWT